jgi:carbon starvation protein
VWLANWSNSKQLISTGGPMVVMVSITVLGLLWLALHHNVYAKFLNDARVAERVRGPIGTLAREIGELP